MADKTASAVATTEPADLLQAGSWEEVVKIAGDMAAITPVAEVLGDGFSLLKNKERLCGIPFFILGYRLNAAEDDKTRIGDFWSIYLMTNAGDKFVIVDGSTGIAKQLEDLDEQGVQLPIYCQQGLRVSRYTFEDEDGNDKPAETFYFDTSTSA